eukprot:1752035-Pyramimonas_sp.AAC.1
MVSVKSWRENRILSRVMRWLHKVLTVNVTVCVSSPSCRCDSTQTYGVRKELAGELNFLESDEMA